MTIIEKRRAYQPFEYEPAYDFWLQQQQAHWLHLEVNMSSTIEDWNQHMLEAEKKVAAGVLLGFTQAEVEIGQYWAQKVNKWFPKPEIQMMACAFASTETIHEKAYNYLSETLGLQEYDAFLAEPTAAAKLDNLINTPSESLEDIALSLAVYSGFGEGVSLFSSFAILLHFSRMPRSLMQGVGDIVRFSVKEETLHSNGGCWLYRTLVSEFPELKKVNDAIYEGAKTTIQLEHYFIDRVFNNEPIPHLDPNDIKAFIEYRANTKLQDLNLQPIFNPDLEAAWRIIEWFEPMTVGVKHTDFFAGRVTEYSKGKFKVEDINWNNALKTY